MATPTLTLINAGAGTLTDGFVGTNADAENATGWTDFSTLDTDIKVQGSNAISGIGRANNEDMYYDNGTAAITAAGKVFRAWFYTTNTPYMGIIGGANPYELLFYDGTTTTRKAMLGSDTYEGGWVYVFQDMDLVTTGNNWSANVTLANIQRWGLTTGHDSNAKNALNVWADAFRYMDGYAITGGTSGDKVTMNNLYTADMLGATPNGYGITQSTRGIYFGTGTVQIGSGSDTTYFECDGEVWQFVNTVGFLNVSDGLYKISVSGSNTNCDIKGSVIRGPSASGSTRVYFDFSDAGSTISFTDNLIVNGATTILGSGHTITGNTFDDCSTIINSGSNMSRCVIKNYSGSIDTSALIWNTGSDPDGYLDEISFTTGSIAAHAIEFGTACPVTMSLREMQFNGYNGSNNQNDSTLYFDDKGTDTSWLINNAGSVGNISYKTARVGDTVTIQTTRTITIRVQDSDNNPIENARVGIYSGSTDGVGDLEIMNELTDVSGIATQEYGGSDGGVRIKVRKASAADDPRYESFSTLGTIDSGNFNLLVTLREDQNNA